ncbi:MAG: YidC/Oxa1 family membrane protein insertase [bacterium]
MNPIEPIAQLMIEALKFFLPLSFNNLGVAIILLTAAVKLALYPLTVQSTVQMAKMSKVQPELAELQKKHKGKPELLQKEMMELYKKHGANPLGGCLPMLLQIPFFIGLFYALTGPAFNVIANQPGVNQQFLWLNSMVLKDPYYILAVLIGLTTYWTQKVTMSSGSSAQQKQMLYFMPAFIAFISVSFPAGVQIYWIVQNLLGGIQQVYILKKKS